jgi:Fe-S oxidoreductase
MDIKEYYEHAAALWTKNIKFGSKLCDADHKVIIVHPECNLIFFVGEERTLIEYDMDCRKVHVIPACVIRYWRPSMSRYK